MTDKNNNPTGHHIKFCQHCNAVISQCRCLNCNKRVLYGVCQECAKNPSFPFPDPRDAEIASLRAEVARLERELMAVYGGLLPEGSVTIGTGER